MHEIVSEYRAKENALDALVARLAAEMPAALAAATGAEWTLARQHERGFVLQRADAYAVSFYLSTHPRLRLGVAFSPPKADTGETIEWGYVRRSEKRPEIHVSADKTAEQIARDVARRMLPALDAAWPGFAAYLDKEAGTLAAFNAVCERLRQMGAEVLQAGAHRGATQEAGAHWNRMGPNSLSVKIGRGGTVQINEGFGIADAETVLRTVLAVRGVKAKG